MKGPQMGFISLKILFLHEFECIQLGFLSLLVDNIAPAHFTPGFYLPCPRKRESL